MGCSWAIAPRLDVKKGNDHETVEPEQKHAVWPVPGAAKTTGEITILLSNGIELQIATGGEAAFIEGIEESKRVQASREMSGFVFKSALVLARLISVEPAWIQSKRVIELGCGTGICGLVAGAMGAQKVTLTDKTTFVAGYNLRNNLKTFPNLRDTFHLHTLSWGDPEAIALTQPPFDVILGSDLMYIPGSFQALSETIVALSGPGSVVLMVTPRWLREGTVEKHCFEHPLRQHGFKIENVAAEEPLAEIIRELVGQDCVGDIRVIVMRR